MTSPEKRPSAPHPFIVIARDRVIRTLWLGLSAQALGEEIFRMAVIWLAIGLVGAAASTLTAAQCLAVLVVSVASGAFVDGWRPARVLLGTNVMRALLAVVPVAVFTWYGPSFLTLLIVGVALSSLRSLFEPMLSSCVPVVAGGTERMQAVNALFDATQRVARLLGPLVAGVLLFALKPEELMLVTAAGFVISALAIAQVGGALESAPGVKAAAGLTDRLMQGLTVARRDRVVGRVLVANGVILAGWMITLTLGIAMLAAERAPFGLEANPVLAVSFVLGSFGLGDVVANWFVAAKRPADRWHTMFAGYVLLGGGIAGIALSHAFIAGPLQLPCMMLCAAAAGAGSPMFFVNMITLFQLRLGGADLTSVLRLRYALLGGAMTVGALIGGAAYAAIGAGTTVFLAGAAMALTGVWGLATRPAEMVVQRPHPAE